MESYHFLPILPPPSFAGIRFFLYTTALCSVFIGRKAMTNLDSTLKGRDITLLTKIHLVKAMVFPVVMHGCES